MPKINFGCCKFSEDHPITMTLNVHRYIMLGHFKEFHHRKFYIQKDLQKLTEILKKRRYKLLPYIFRKTNKNETKILEKTSYPFR